MVTKVSSINFGKKRFLPTLTTNKLQIVLKKMNSETTLSSNEFSFSSNILCGLILKNNSKTLCSIVDSSACIRPIDKVTQGQNNVEIGKRINLVINNQTGEILQTWKKTYNKVEKFLNYIQSNFDNPEKIEKRHLTLRGFTQKGVEKLTGA